MSRSDDIATVLGDPPQVHDGAPRGIWSTDRSCYQFIADSCPATAATLETGLGSSTALFARWSTAHTCVVHSADEVERFCEYAAERDLEISHIAFEVGSSDLVLPRLDVPPVDVAFIDGGHGFPLPILDWFYAARLLRPGGVVVIDDIQLPSVSDYLVRFLQRDPRWTHAGGDSTKWIAFRKGSDVQLPEEWLQQPFLGGPRPAPFRLRWRQELRRFASRIKHAVRR